jgi:hypothetical protein
MKIIFDKDDMINFVSWYDGKHEKDCLASFEMEFNEWVRLQNCENPVHDVQVDADGRCHWCNLKYKKY